MPPHRCWSGRASGWTRTAAPWSGTGVRCGSPSRSSRSWRMLRPPHTVTATARRPSGSTLHEPIALEGPQDETKDLADTFDGCRTGSAAPSTRSAGSSPTPRRAAHPADDQPDRAGGRAGRAKESAGDQAPAPYRNPAAGRGAQHIGPARGTVRRGGGAGRAGGRGRRPGPGAVALPSRPAASSTGLITPFTRSPSRSLPGPAAPPHPNRPSPCGFGRSQSAIIGA